MTTKEFVEKFESFSNSTLKKSFVEENVKKDMYLPYSRKDSLCSSIANASLHDTIKINGEEKEVFKRQSSVRYVLFITNLVNEYTNIDIDFTNDILGQFEDLDRIGVIETILENIPEKEYVDCETLLNMYIDDITLNENSIINYIDNKLESLRFVGGTILDTFVDILSQDINSEDNGIENETEESNETKDVIDTEE